jgi:orotidine-5'-phosphate decarboxylase
MFPRRLRGPVTIIAMNHFADRLLEAVEKKGAAVCVGIDPVYQRLPAAVRGAQTSAVDAIGVWGRGILKAIAPHTPVVKFQSACFERYHQQGVACLNDLMRHATDAGLIVILDAKRADIGVTSEHYAAAALEVADAVTVNPYMGPDSLQPFVDLAAAQGKGVFVLVRTSNPGGDRLQSLRLEGGHTLAEEAAAMTAELGAEHVGSRGYSLVGAVVGATKPTDMAALRRKMPRQIFLMPGVGAQGGAAEDIEAALDEHDGGVLVSASRSVIYPAGAIEAKDWAGHVGRAAEAFCHQIAAIG